MQRQRASWRSPQTSWGMALLLACGAAGGCSFILNWNVDGLACDTNNFLACDQNYHCLPDGNSYHCIKDGSRTQDQSCLLDVECQTGLLCPAGTCVPQCAVTDAYADPSPCAAGRFCAPYLSTAGITDLNDHNVLLVAVCAKSDGCAPGLPCTQVPGGGVCTPISNGATACIAACTVQFTAGSYSNSCAPGNHYPNYCTPVGQPGSQELVCLSTGPRPSGVNQPCLSPVAQPCDTPYGCINEVCRSYCDEVNPNCPTGQQCCGHNLDPCNRIAYCVEPNQCG